MPDGASLHYSARTRGIKNYDPLGRVIIVKIRLQSAAAAAVIVLAVTGCGGGLSNTPAPTRAPASPAAPKVAPVLGLIGCDGNNPKGTTCDNPGDPTGRSNSTPEGVGPDYPTDAASDHIGHHCRDEFMNAAQPDYGWKTLDQAVSDVVFTVTSDTATTAYSFSEPPLLHAHLLEYDYLVKSTGHHGSFACIGYHLDLAIMINPSGPGTGVALRIYS